MVILATFRPEWGSVSLYPHGIYVLFYFFIITVTFQPNSSEVFPSAIFWTSRGHRCRLFPQVRAFHFYHAQGSAFPLLVDFHRMLLAHALALSANHFFYARKNPYKYMHSVRIALAKLILVGTRITYQATGDAGLRICDT